MMGAMPDNPFVKPVTRVDLVSPKVDGQDRVSVVVLEKIEPGVVPDYCVHGRVSCHRCQDWCWLGSETYKQVINGVVGLCIQCATETIPPDVGPAVHLEDH